MQMVDFEYNGERLSDYGLSICCFDDPDEIVEIGSNVEINKVKAPNSYKYMATSVSYTDGDLPPIQVCKSFCQENYIFNEEELRRYIRWLNRKGYYKFKPIYDDSTFTDVYWEVTFNVKLIKVEGNIVGLDLTMNANAPYGYVEPVEYKAELNRNNQGKLIIQDFSDEVGYIYCDVILTCLEAGSYTIMNSADPMNNVCINNCVAGETIIMLGQQKIIKSGDGLSGGGSDPMLLSAYDESHPKLYNDFNYNFLRICNTYDNSQNIITCDHDCKITVKYSPVRKVGLII